MTVMATGTMPHKGRLPESVDNAVMLGHVRSIRWTKDGWPLVMPERYGAVPQAAITEEELIGDWEHIDLSYVFGQQKESSTMTLTDDHKVSEEPGKIVHGVSTPRIKF